MRRAVQAASGILHTWRTASRSVTAAQGWEVQASVFKAMAPRRTGRLPDRGDRPLPRHGGGDAQRPGLRGYRSRGRRSLRNRMAARPKPSRASRSTHCSRMRVGISPTARASCSNTRCRTERRPTTCSAWDHRGDCQGREDQPVLRQSGPAVDATCASHRRVDSRWAAAGRDDAGGADGAVSGRVECAEKNHSTLQVTQLHLNCDRRPHIWLAKLLTRGSRVIALGG